ncbi:MAG: zinc ribbon domain-containing protein [Proteobacteria bacterium]|nr:zinc ribbon domain-containing protein [Pseudomonadota bacterium]MBU1595825.1 zinc ribbon domain-containing protein [Pseudomonadota bacterium]
MIICTGCGTKNQDDAQACGKCGRKLQSRWSAPAANGGQNGQGGGSKLSALAEPVWQAIEPIVHSIEEGADELVRSCAETWAYALILIAGVGVYIVAEDWRYLAGSVALAAVLAKARGI